MKVMITQRTNVKRLGKYATSVGNLATNVRDLNGRLASMRDDAFVRLRTARSSNIGKTEGARVALEFDYIKGANPVVIKYDKLSPALAKRAVEANAKNQYSCTDSTKRYDTTAKKAEREEQSGVPYEKRSAILLPRENFRMSPDENSNHFAFFLEDLAEREGKNSYFILNDKNPIVVYLINKKIIDGERDSQLLQSQSGTIVVPYGWFRSLGSWSGLDGFNRLACDCGGRARGVLRGSGEATSPKISVANRFSEKQIERYARKVARVREALNAGRINVSKLEKDLAEVSEFLKSEQ